MGGPSGQRVRWSRSSRRDRDRCRKLRSLLRYSLFGQTNCHHRPRLCRGNGTDFVVLACSSRSASIVVNRRGLDPHVRPGRRSRRDRDCLHLRLRGRLDQRDLQRLVACGVAADRAGIVLAAEHQHAGRGNSQAGQRDAGEDRIAGEGAVARAANARRRATATMSRKVSSADRSIGYAVRHSQPTHATARRTGAKTPGRRGGRA